MSEGSAPGAIGFDPLSPGAPWTLALAPSRWTQDFLAQGRRLVSWLPVGWGLGAIAYFLPRSEPGFLTAAGLLAVGLILTIRGWHAFWPRCLGLALCVLALGFLDMRWCAHRQAPMPALPSRAVVLSGDVRSVVVMSPRMDGDAPGRRIVLDRAVFETGVDIGMMPMRRALRLRLRDDDAVDLRPGAHVRLRALLRPPPFPALPGGRDAQRIAWFDGSAGGGYALGDVRVLSQGRAPLLEGLRERIAGIVQAALPGQSGAIAATLLAGETGGLSVGTRDDFAAAGLAHLLAVAGLHLGLVMGCVIATLRFAMAAWPWIALRWPCKEIACSIGLAGGAGYVLLTGAHLPAIRALGMAGLATLALLLGRRPLSLRSLSLVVWAILIVAPQDVLDVSFQMSFAAVLALIAGYDELRDPLMRLRGDGRFARVALSHLVALGLTSLLAGAATLPVSLAHFGMLQPWFVLANLVAVPIAAVWIMPCGLLALLAMPLHLAGVPLGLMGAGIRVVMHLAHGVAGLPLASRAVPMMPGWGLLLYLLGLCWLCLWKGPARCLACVPIVVALAAPWMAARPDVLIAPDAGAMAVRMGSVLAMGPVSGLDRQVVSDWMQATALPVTPLSGCAGGLCRVGSVLLRPDDRRDGSVLPPGDACRGVGLFVSQSPAREACPQAVAIDRFSVWRDGAYAAYAMPGGWRVVSDRAWRGARLWVPAPGGHGMPNLPMAVAE
ncbi:DNA translocation competence protein ComA/ComEC/Rec2 [Neoasaia chiangmaiensis NBRC 101099]|uniref:ComEC/Rec2 family competence protein n=1 Tax=Neoasaia chiangmaiensis TaxID=320497 RepID=UPI00098A09B6|nr:ComEC/Rec2 family competence protein [Neoasaia chiangmaiensis]GBR38796.1 DNA translocation competence protein ComA/ComEC/Rec2 [Neoasaia chiangmaiensis NBRC 101099]GEN15718.1 hypothetical protein NCH01_21490 [Neoasaia chiangmaiensis]